MGQLKKVIALQTAMSKKGRQFFKGKIGVTPSVGAPAPGMTPTLVSAGFQYRKG